MIASNRLNLESVFFTLRLYCLEYLSLNSTDQPKSLNEDNFNIMLATVMNA